MAKKKTSSDDYAFIIHAMNQMNREVRTVSEREIDMSYLPTRNLYPGGLNAYDVRYEPNWMTSEAVSTSIETVTIPKDEWRRMADMVANPRMMVGGSSVGAEVLIQAQATIEAQQAELQRLSEESTDTGVVVQVSAKEVIISQNGSIKAAGKPAFDLEVGDHVVLFATGQIVRKLEVFKAGVIADVVEVGETTSTVSSNGTKKIVPNGKFAFKKGDKVLLDERSGVMFRKVDDESIKAVTPPPVVWDDIRGLEEAKASVMEAVELPHKFKDVFAQYGKKPTKGILLFGPPGCGKTLLGKAAANSLAATYGGSGESGFIYIKGPELLSKWVGESEEQVRNLFEKARRHKAEHGFPAVIFIDEAEALLAKRGGDGIVSAMSGTIVPAFLTEMDGLEESAAIVILATNRHDILDPAITREGRIDRKIKVTRPNEVHGCEIILHGLMKAPLAHGLEALSMAAAAATAFYSKERVLYKIRLKDDEVIPFTMAELVNGAMLAGIVEHAKSLAIRRDMASGVFSGVTLDDLLSSVEHITLQNLEMNHTDDVNLFTEPFKDKVADIMQAR